MLVLKFCNIRGGRSLFSSAMTRSSSPSGVFFMVELTVVERGLVYCYYCWVPRLLVLFSVAEDGCIYREESGVSSSAAAASASAIPSSSSVFEASDARSESSLSTVVSPDSVPENNGHCFFLGAAARKVRDVSSQFGSCKGFAIPTTWIIPAMFCIYVEAISSIGTEANL